MNIAKTLTVSVTADEILESIVQEAEGCTSAEAEQILISADIRFDIKESGHPDHGDYKKELKGISITYEN